MNHTDITALHRNIYNLIEEKHFRDAYLQLYYLIQQSASGELFDRLNAQETNYRFLLHYTMSGVQDPQQDQILANMSREMLSIADKAYREWCQAFSPRWYYAQLRYRKMDAHVSPDLESIEKILSDAKDELSLLSESKNDFATAPRKLELQKRIAAAEADYFSTILFSSPWHSAEKQSYIKTFAEMTLPGKAMAVSALLLALQELFDEHKLSFLMELCQNQEPQVSMRALTALLLLLLQHDARLKHCPSLQAQLSLLLDGPALRSRLPMIYAQLLREKFNEQITKKLQDELLPEMNKLSESLQDKFERSDKITFDKSDIDDIISDGAMSSAMQQLSDLQTQGEDVYMSTFSQLKFYPFFKDIHHWFLPFYAENPALTELFGKDDLKDLGVLKVVTGSAFLCDSDKYSFCLNLTQVPEQYRASMVSNMGADSEQFRELMDMEQNGNQQLKQESISNLYIHDLYRFYKLFPSHADFYNVFNTSLDFFSVKPLENIFTETSAMQMLAAMYLKKYQYATAAYLYDRLIDMYPDNFEYQRSYAYCQEKMKHFNKAAQAYRNADLMRADQAWVLKRWAYCSKQVDDYAQALELYRRLLSLDGENRDYLMSVGSCLMHMKDYDAAINTYYKYEFLHGESMQTWRPISWCLLMQGKYEQAAVAFRKIMDADPDKDDYLCYGHFCVAQKKFKDAVEAYAKSFRVSTMSKDDFYKRFDKDLQELTIFGLDKMQLAILSDSLKYKIEEND